MGRWIWLDFNNEADFVILFISRADVHIRCPEVLTETLMNLKFDEELIFDTFRHTEKVLRCENYNFGSICLALQAKVTLEPR